MSESILERWQRLDALLEAGRAVAGLRTAVHALEVIAMVDGPAGDMAATAIKNVERDLVPDA